mmetsp:Transcript_101519/g.287441  ORF Transcript_101519/g.287441 Transcript_101519/m.287441 type:complete len:403 (-) Transcript_101519:14-1222(-)
MRPSVASAMDALSASSSSASDENCLLVAGFSGWPSSNCRASASLVRRSARAWSKRDSPFKSMQSKTKTWTLLVDPSHVAGATDGLLDRSWKGNNLPHCATATTSASRIAEVTPVRKQLFTIRIASGYFCVTSLRFREYTFSQSGPMCICIRTPSYFQSAVHVLPSSKCANTSSTPRVGFAAMGDNAVPSWAVADASFPLSLGNIKAFTIESASASRAKRARTSADVSLGSAGSTLSARASRTVWAATRTRRPLPSRVRTRYLASVGPTCRSKSTTRPTRHCTALLPDTLLISNIRSRTCRSDSPSEGARARRGAARKTTSTAVPQSSAPPLSSSSSAWALAAGSTACTACLMSAAPTFSCEPWPLRGPGWIWHSARRTASVSSSVPSFATLTKYSVSANFAR